jgi:hypothetical protein
VIWGKISGLALLGAAGLALAFALVGNGCKFEREQITITGNAEPAAKGMVSFQKLYSTYANGKRVTVYYKLTIADPPGYFKGTSRVVSMKGKSALLTPFAKATMFGSGPVEATNVLSGSQLVRVEGKNRGDALCLSLALKTVPKYPTAVAIGTFKAVGGAGKGATLRAGGRFLIVSPQVPAPTATSGSANMWMAVNSLSKGSSRALSTACKNAGKPPAPPAKATATLDGYVFAPAGAKSVPAGGTVYPDGSSISGGVGCGSDNNLFLVVTYGGPATKANGGFFGPVTTNINASVKAGKNLLPLGANLPNGSYSLKLGFASGAAPFGGNVFLQRSC